jgi:ElaA protein
VCPSPERPGTAASVAGVEVHAAHVRDIDPVTLYGILRLRADVFVVEQNCVYADLDGRDLEPDARLLWLERDGAVVAALRMLADPAGHRVGRVVTAARVRTEGLGARLIEYAVGLAGTDLVLDAQSHLERWYERFGFARNGAQFVEDGIPHVPMIRRTSPPP